MTNSSKTVSNKRKSVTVMPSPANSIVSYTSSSSSSMTSSTMSGSSNNNWLPPISTLLSHIHDADTKTTIQYESNTTSVPYYHILDPQETILPKQKKRKTQSQPQQLQKRAVYMPMIPYYFHHEKFGIEACMLQLEGQKKFNNYYYI